MVNDTKERIIDLRLRLLELVDTLNGVHSSTSRLVDSDLPEASGIKLRYALYCSERSLDVIDLGLDNISKSIFFMNEVIDEE